MIKVGIAGIGFMGLIHNLAYRKTRGAKVVAFCEMDKTRLGGDWTGIKGNFGPAGTMMDMSPYATYEQFDEMVADPNIDMVDICLPPALHATMAIKALNAGKHVFCEKPMAMTTADTRRMVAAAEKADRLLLIGHVVPMFAEYAYALKVIDSGRYGELLGGTFKRVISDPLWLPDFYNPKTVGGPMLDLHIHDAHFIRLLFGNPESVTSVGRMRGEVAEYFNTIFRFADPKIVVAATSGVINQQGRSFTHGFEIHLEKATMTFEFAVIDGEPVMLMPLTVLTSRGEAKRPRLGSGDPVDAFVAELKEVIASVKAGRQSKILGAGLAQDALNLCHKQTQAIAKGRPVKV